MFLRTSRAGAWMRTRLTSTGAFHSFDGWTDTEHPDTVWYRAAWYRLIQSSPIVMPCQYSGTFQLLDKDWRENSLKPRLLASKYPWYKFDQLLLYNFHCLFLCLSLGLFHLFVCFLVLSLEDAVHLYYIYIVAEEDKLWSKAHLEKRNRPLLTNVLKHCKNATRLKSQHLGCSACTIWLTQCSITRWHWNFNIHGSPSLSIRKGFLMFGYNLWLKCLKGGGYFYVYIDRVGAWYSILIKNNEGRGDLEEVSLLLNAYDGVCTIGMFASFLGAMIWLLHFDIETQFLCKNCQLSR